MRLTTALVLASAAVLAGCAATVTRDAPPAAASSPSTVSPAAAKTLVLEVTGVGAGATGSREDWNAFLEEWQTSMTAAAAARGIQFTLAKPGMQPPTGPAVLVRMKVNDYRYVSQAKRYAVGIMAGNAFMDLDVDFVELPQNRTVATRKFKTTSSAWQGVFSAMTPKQVEAVSKEIVAEVGGK